MDENTQVAESSPATTIEVPRDPAAYAEWRTTGKTPEPSPSKPEASAAAEPQSAASDEAENHAPASEAGNPKQERNKPRKDSQVRLDEILADLRAAGLSPSELKTFKRQAQQQAETPKPAETSKPAEQPKPEQTVKPVEPEGLKKPKADDYATWAEYEAARDDYFERLADHRAEQALARDRARVAQEARAKEFGQKLTDADQRYGAESRAAIGTAARAVHELQQGAPAVWQIVEDSPVMVDFLYALGAEPAALNAFIGLAKTNPGLAMRKAVLIEQHVQNELAKGGGSSASAGENTPRDASGKFQAAPAKKATSAPPPAREVSGRAGTPPDEVESALKNSDFASFRRAQNQRDIAKRKSG